MKSTYLLRLMSLIIAVAVLAGCSKDDQLAPNASNTEKMVKAPPVWPIYNYGFITGQLSPVPVFSAIKVYNNEGFSIEYRPGTDGSIKIINLPADTYNLMIVYTIQKGELNYNGTHEIFRIPVKDGEATELGVINLPWSF